MSDTWFDFAILVSSVMMSLTALAAVARLLRGPGLLDRIVALDVLAAVVVGLTVVAAIRAEQPFLIDVGLTIALVSFVATMAVAHFMEERGRDA